MSEKDICIIYPDGSLQDVCQIIETAKQRVAINVNSELTLMYWNIRKRINKFGFVAGFKPTNRHLLVSRSGSPLRCAPDHPTSKLHCRPSRKDWDRVVSAALRLQSPNSLPPSRTIKASEATVIDIKAKYDAKCGAPSVGSPKVFFKYFYINTATGEKSGEVLAQAKLSE